MSINDLIETKVVLFAFTREVSMTLGILPINITIGTKTALSAFFVIDYTSNYNTLFERDWIHANRCVSSSLHYFLLFWKGNEVEMVRADKQPFMAVIGFVESMYYDKEFGPIMSTSRRKDGSQGKHTWTQRARWKSKRKQPNS